MRLTAMSSAAQPSRWSRPIVGVGVVVVIGAALGAVFGIRAVAGSGSAPAAAQPSARSVAAMAYDAATKSVVLFGGQGRSRGLDDTWIWDGSAWTQAHPSTSPPALDNAAMTYDPVTHDVILVGTSEPSGIELPIACSSGSGSASSGASSAAGGVPPGAALPDIAPVPGATSAARHSTPDDSSSCGTSLAPKAATWLWNGSDWSKFTGSTPLVEFGSGTLATDPVAGRVVLLTRGPFAEPAVGASQPALACPLQSAATPEGQPMCPFLPVVALAWTWTGHEWKEMTPAAGTSAFDLVGASIIDDAVSGKLATFSGGDFIAPIPSPPACEGCVSGAPQPAQQSTCCTGTESVWTGVSWKQVATYRDGPFTSGIVFVGDPATHSDVVLAGDGTTWVWNGTWKQMHPGTTPPIVSGPASAYDAASGQVVMFGGYGTTSRESGLYDQTWTWDGSDWTKRGGTTGPSATIPVPSPVSVPPGLPCEPVVAPKSPLGAQVAEPTTVCNGVSGSGAGSAGSTGSVSSGSGVAAP
jgi:hypothetical protein